jgi:hypothetical protein
LGFNINSLSKILWEGHRKYITGAFALAFISALAYTFTNNPFIGVIFTLISAIAISMLFDLTTRETVKAEIKQTLEEHLGRIIVPYHEHIKEPFQKFLIHLNKTSVPYETKRETHIYFNEIDLEKRVIRMDIVTKILFDENQLQGKDVIRRKFEIPIPLREIESVLNIKEGELEEKLESNLYGLISNLRSELIKGVKLGNRKVNNLSDVITNEKAKLVGNQLIYAGEFLFPVQEMKKSAVSSHLEITLVDTGNLSDGYTLVFKSFCREFICHINLDNQILKVCKRSPEELLKLTPITFKGIGAHDDYVKEHMTQKAIRAYCKNLLPGSVFFIEWDFTPPSPPSP